MDSLVEPVLQKFSRELGRDLKAAYLYGSLAQRRYVAGESDANLLLVVSEGVSLHTVRNIFRPIWRDNGRRLCRAPLITTRSLLTRHLKLYPTLAHHMANDGQSLVGGTSLFKLIPKLPRLTPHDTYAWLAGEAMISSAALAPNMQSGPDARQSMKGLRSLARRVLHETVSVNDTAVDLFARIQEHLEPKIAVLPMEQPWSSMRTATSPLLPGLQGTYTKNLETAVLVFAQFSSAQIRNIGWSKLSQRLSRDHKRLAITTSRQFRLMTEFETPLDLIFRRNRHTWGMDPLATMVVKKKFQLRHAARAPSLIQIDLLPNAYLTQSDDQLPKLIHDFQNKLLNIQLEGELLDRFQIAQRFRPLPLPGRETPLRERVDAIYQQLGLWADHYTNAMTQA